MKEYWEILRRMAAHPVAFFGGEFARKDLPSAKTFARRTGLCLAALFFLVEMLTGGRMTWTLLLAAAFSMVVLPFLMEAVAFLWGGLALLASRLLGEPLEAPVVRKVWGYSTAGLLPLALGGGWLSLLAVWTVALQTLGLEKSLSCSRFRAAVLAGFPFLLLVTMAFMVAVIFKTRFF